MQGAQLLCSHCKAAVLQLCCLKSLSSVQAATDLDTVIAAHNQYLETLLKKALLDDNVADRPGAAAQNGLQGHLHMILCHMLNLMGPVARLNEAVSNRLF